MELKIEVQVTELDVMKELVYLCIEHYLDLPEEMRVSFDEWQDKVKG